jgi:glycosyltransferase involved in cell wall biosynthesis
MKVLFIHNYYRSSAPSGEDAVADNERKVLGDNGVDVVAYKKFNDEIDEHSFINRAKLGLNCAWSQGTYSELINLLKQIHPEVAHIHSIHPQISPSAYAACQDMGVPVVHTLHNFRYICPQAMLYRDGRPCEDCVGNWPLNALRFKCYRGSLMATGALVWMITYNRLRGTFINQVNRYIALTEFAAGRLAAGGLPADRIEVKPNFLPNPPASRYQREHYAVYVGRLSQEKGVGTLLTAWRSVVGLPLKILGDGPLRRSLESQAREQGIDVEFLGSLDRKDVLPIVGGSLLQIVPSECYEGFPMVILEAYACATPVVASRIGSLVEIVPDGEVGLHFEPGDPKDLANKVNILVSNPEMAAKMGKRAREIFLQKYTPEKNFKMLMGIYQRAREDFQLRAK